MIASVIVDVEHHAVDKHFDYLVPKNLEDVVQVGQRVLIPFGPRSISGIIIALKDKTEIPKLKTIQSIHDFVPLFEIEHLRLAEAMSYRYASSQAKYLNLMLPNALRLSYQKNYTCLDKTKLPTTLLKYFESNDLVSSDQIETSDFKALKNALEMGIVKEDTVIKQKQKPKIKKIITLIKDDPVRGTKQQALIDYLKTNKKVEQSVLLKATNATHSSLKSLTDKGIINVEEVVHYRAVELLHQPGDKAIHYTKPQETVIDTVKQAFNTYTPFLLHGVTSSGKTEVYMALTEHALKQNKSVLILVPEISLTPALTARFKSRFKDDVALYHSHLSMGEQYDEWRKVKLGKARIIIGARSAIFAPLKDIGLIIIDEEHSDAYLQTDTPKYDAISVAHDRARTHKAPLLLGSATPSVTRYYQALNNQYVLLELKERVLNSQLPTIQTVDMKQEFLNGNRSIFSKKLKSAMDERLVNNQQILLLINRRGHANFVLCRSCGETIDCDHCDVSMTYHNTHKNLQCHYCNRTKPIPTTCPNCQSTHIRYMGIGTERIENELNKLYPDKAIYRMDRDTTSKKQAHEKILHDFEKNGDILVGTQMISKGLDFANVTLVGILSADMSLFIPDFYAKESTFNLLTQMAGRSGRRDALGEVIIQAYNDDHPVLEDVKTDNYKQFYLREIASRKKAELPPFKNLTAITVTHDDANTVFKETSKIAKICKKELSQQARIIGPIKPKIHKIKDRYRMHILIKYNEETMLYDLLNRLQNNFSKQQTHLSIDHHPTLL